MSGIWRGAPRIHRNRGHVPSELLSPTEFRNRRQIGDKSAINFKEKIVEYLAEHEEARSREIADIIGLKISRTKDYITELVEEGKIVSNGANKNRTYSLKK